MRWVRDWFPTEGQVFETSSATRTETFKAPVFRTPSNSATIRLAITLVDSNWTLGPLDQIPLVIAYRPKSGTASHPDEPESPRSPLGTTSVQLRERKNGLLIPKRHQTKHLEFVLSQFGTRGSEVQILSPRPLFSVSGPETWVTECTGYIGDNLGPNGLSSGSSTRVSRSK